MENIKKTLKTVVATANAKGKLSADMFVRRDHAWRFINTLAKRMRLQTIIESQPMSVNQFEKREDALCQIKHVDKRLAGFCLSYGLPNDYNKIDDAFHELFGMRAEAIQNILRHDLVIVAAAVADSV